ncbi:MAG: Slp family lipoprotein [Gammaproteobacteria bacterium]|nr:MAG: Slp family lipoprotein [Gammaproteobacteria bacterium]
MFSMRTPWLLLSALVLLAGCASPIPEPIRLAPEGDVQLAEVRRESQRFVGSQVRWGGSIASVRNLREATLIEVVGRRLDKRGRPREEDRSEGRFLVKVPGFLDPAVYAEGREVTVRGRIEGAVERPIGEFRYTYPVVRAERVHLWEPRPLPAPAYPYYDPFLRDPWYPWGWPYYPYHPPRYH